MAACGAQARDAPARCYGAVLFLTPDGMSAWVVGPFAPAQCKAKTSQMAKTVADMDKTGGPVQATQTGTRDVLLPILVRTWFCARDPGYEELDSGPDGIRGRYLCNGPLSQYSR